MRPVLTALALLAAGCGTVVPYSVAPDVLAPDLVPEQAASVTVVTDRSPSEGRAAVAGRVVDRDTGVPLAARIVVGAAEMTADRSGDFAVPVDAGETVVRVTLDGYAPAETTLSVAPGERTTLLAVLGRAD